VKTAIRGSRFQDIDDMKNVTTKLNMVSLSVIDDCNLERCKGCVAREITLNKFKTISFIFCTYLFLHPQAWNFIVGLCVQRNRFAG
jgi:hypothetical protein